MEDENGVIDVDTNLPSVLPPGKAVLNSKQMMNNAIARAEIVEKMQELAIKHTKPNDWIDYGGKPGIAGPGAERVARTIGLVATGCVATTEDLPGDDGGYIVYVNGRMGFPGGEFIEVTGSCCSTKGFFVAKGAVNPGDIHKNALTNFYVNGVSRFIGLRGLTWEDLKEISGGKITQDKAQKIEYGSQKPIERGNRETAKAKMAWEWLLEMNGGAVKEAKEQLQKLTAFKDFDGYTNINKASDKVINILYPKVEKLYEQWDKSMAKANLIPETTKKEKKETQDRVPGMEG